MMLITHTFAKMFLLDLGIFILLLIKSLSCNTMINTLGMYVLCICDIVFSRSIQAPEARTEGQYRLI